VRAPGKVERDRCRPARAAAGGARRTALGAAGRRPEVIAAARASRAAPTEYALSCWRSAAHTACATFAWMASASVASTVPGGEIRAAPANGSPGSPRTRSIPVSSASGANVEKST